MERNDERRGNSLHAMTPEQELEIRAGEQMFGRGTWSYVEDGVLHAGPVPPRDPWEGRKETALAAARVHELMEEALRPVLGAMDDAAAAVEEAEGEDYGLYPAACGLREAAHRLRGILRDGIDGDDMNVTAPSLFAAVFAELDRARREPETPAVSPNPDETNDRRGA